MSGAISKVDGGTITTARGFRAGGTYAGIKTYSDDKMDVGMLLSGYPLRRGPGCSPRAASYRLR